MGIGLGPHLRTMLVTLICIGVAFAVFFAGRKDGYKVGFEAGRVQESYLLQNAEDILRKNMDERAHYKAEIARLRATTQPVADVASR